MYGFLAAVNLAAFSLYGIDKFKARRGLWRIPESVLLFMAAAGGSGGALLGMRFFHHKTSCDAASAAPGSVVFLFPLRWEEARYLRTWPKYMKKSIGSCSDCLL